VSLDQGEAFLALRRCFVVWMEHELYDKSTRMASRWFSMDGREGCLEEVCP